MALGGPSRTHPACEVSGIWAALGKLGTVIVATCGWSLVRPGMEAMLKLHLGWTQALAATMRVDGRAFWDLPPGRTSLSLLLAPGPGLGERGQRAAPSQLWLGAAAQRLARIDFPSTDPFSLTKSSLTQVAAAAPSPRSGGRALLPAGAVFCLWDSFL